jgi:hypothetical protein
MAAWMLPGLALPVPMESKLGQRGGGLRRLAVIKPYPNPLADYLGQFPKARGLDVQELFGGKCPVLDSPPEINPVRLFWIAGFGNRRWPDIRRCSRFHCEMCCFHSFFLKPLSVTLPYAARFATLEDSDAARGVH